MEMMPVWGVGRETEIECREGNRLREKGKYYMILLIHIF